MEDNEKGTHLTVPDALRSPKPLLTRQFEVIQGDTPKEFTRKLISKFGKKYLDLVKQYGAVEYEVDETGEIVDVLPPEEYLAESDEFAIERFRTGAHGTRHYSITAGALARLANAEAQFYAVQYEQLRNEPSFFREQVELAARHRPELIQDINGSAPTAESLLAIPRFVGQLARFTVHNLLRHLGIWNTIAKYLTDIQELDDKKGRFGALNERQELMGYVKFMIEQEIEVVEKRVRYGIIMHTVAKQLWVRERNHPDYTGAVLAQNTTVIQQFATYLGTQSLDGAFVRFLSQDVAREILGWTPNQTRNDLFNYLDRDAAQWANLDTYFSEQLTQLRRLMDFSDMLNHPEDVDVPRDTRYRAFGISLQKSELTFKRLSLERHIKNIESLENPSAFARIWKDIDAMFIKEHKMKAERFIGFEQLAPRWHVSSQESPTNFDASGLPHRLPNEARVNRPPSPPPAAIKPYYDKGIIPPPILEEEVLERKGPKVKSRPNKEGESLQEITLSLGAISFTEPTLELPVFRVSKRVYDIFERIFSGGKEKGQLNFTDFQYAMTQLGFRYQPGMGNGSRGVFYPPPSHSNLPYFCHLPHGSRSTLDPIRLRQCASNLSKSYGWTLAWFGLKSEA